MAHLNSDANLVVLEAVEDETLSVAAEYYGRLLAVRKQALSIVRDSLQQRGKTPTEQEVLRECQRVVRDRGFTLASKGVEHAENPNVFNDERLLVRAFIHALTSRRETTVLTRDTDFIEQLFKLTYLVDTHYRSMLVAREYARQPLNFRDISVGDGSPLSGGVLVDVPAGYYRQVLPPAEKGVNINCFRFGGKGAGQKAEQLTFCADPQMRELLEVKRRTRGRSTDELGDRNFHICPHPNLVEELGGCSWVGEDEGWKFERVLLAQPDVEMALQAKERHDGTEVIERPEESDDLEELLLAGQSAGFRVDVRLGLSPSDDWIEMPELRLGRMVRFLPPQTGLYLEKSFLTGYCPPSLAKVLPDARASALRDVLAGIEPGEGHPESLHGSGKLRRFGNRLVRRPLMGDDHPLRTVFDGYVGLLAYRRAVGQIVWDRLAEHHGHDPTEQLWEDHILSIGEGRGLLRARSGLPTADPEDGIVEDRTVVLSAMASVMDGMDTVLLTRSRTVLEQFLTLGSLLTYHYRAWACAVGETDASVNVGGDRTEPEHWMLARLFQSCPTRTVFAPGEAENLLPSDAHPVQWSCWLLEGGGDEPLQVLPHAFLLERPMHALFEARSVSGGRNSNRPDGRNTHYLRHPKKGGIVESVFIGEDARYDFGGPSFPKTGDLDLRCGGFSATELFHSANRADPWKLPWHPSETAKPAPTSEAGVPNK